LRWHQCSLHFVTLQVPIASISVIRCRSAAGGAGHDWPDCIGTSASRRATGPRSPAVAAIAVGCARSRALSRTGRSEAIQERRQTHHEPPHDGLCVRPTGRPASSAAAAWWHHRDAPKYRCSVCDRRFTPSPDISHYLAAVDRVRRDFPACKAIMRLRCAWRGARSWDFSGLRGQRRIGLGGPGGDAVLRARHGGACQAGAPRAFAAALRRTAAAPQRAAAGQPDAIAILMRRTLMRTKAPIFMSLRRMVPQLALSKRV
jgi:hypothetical protein